MWGVTDGSVEEDLLSPLGLVCYGGKSNNVSGMTLYYL